MQVILIFGLEICVVKSRIGGDLGRFYHRVAMWIMGKHPRQRADGSWPFSLLDEVIREVVLEDM